MRVAHQRRVSSAAIAVAGALLIATLVPPAAQAADAVPAEGLIASYAFNGRAGASDDQVTNDVAGAGAATVRNVQASDWTDAGLTLRGGAKGSSGNWVELPDDLLSGAQSATITAEVKPTAAMLNSFHFLWSIGNDSSATEYLFASLNCGSSRTPLAGIKSNGVERLVSADACGVTANQWVNVTVVADAGDLSLYIDGKRVASDDVAIVPADIADQSLNAIGRSPWPDALFQGSISAFRVYDRALTGDQITDVADADAAVHAAELQAAAQGVLDSLDLTDLTTSTHISLPTVNRQVVWTSSQPEIVAPDGTVNPPLSGESSVQVELTATASVRGQTATETITVTVEPSDETVIEHAQRLAEQFTIAPVVADGSVLPTAPAGSSTEVTTLEGAGISITDGTISLAGDAAVDAVITVSVTDELSGTIVPRRFEVRVLPASDATSLLAYNRVPTTAAEANNADIALSMHLAVEEGEGWSPLNENYGIFFPKTSQAVPAGGTSDAIIRSLRDPHLFALADGGYGIVATRVARGGGSDGTQSSKVLFARSTDLLTYQEVGMIDVGVTDGVNDPAAIWDSASGHYLVGWNSDDGVGKYTTFADLTTQSAHGDVRRGAIAATAGAEGAGVAQFDSGNSITISADTASALGVRFGRVSNTTVSPLDEVSLEQGDELAIDDLPARATLAYTDGSTASRAIEWNAADLAAVDTSTQGEYTVTGTVAQPEYPTPFADERADPSIFRYEANGRTRFLMIATEDLHMNPVDPQNGAHMPIRVADRIDDLSDDAIDAGRGAEIDLLRAGDTDAVGKVMTGCFWAPEFHVIDGRLSILFMPCYNGSNGRPDMWTGRASIIQLKQDQSGNDLDPAMPANWTKAEPVVRTDGSVLNHLQDISLDMTFFQDSGQSYYAWQMLGSVFIAHVDPAEPTKLTSEPVRIVVPEYAWDNTIAEGPNVLVENGRLYLIYSGSTVGDTYTTGLATATAGEGVDLTDPDAWTKLNHPIQKSGMFNGEWQLGTGHGMWSHDEDGNLLYVFHARTDHNGLTGRDTFVRRVHFAADGMPVLDMEADEEVAPANRTVSVVVKVVPSASAQLKFSVDVSARCVAGKVVQVVRISNDDAVAIGFDVTSAYGEREFDAIQPSRSASGTFTTRQTSIEDDVLTVIATGPHDGDTVEVTRELVVPAHSCR